MILRALGILLVLAFVLTVAYLVTGCHNLYPEDVASLHSADQQLLQAFQTDSLDQAKAHIRAAFCNEEAVERRHAAGQLDTQIIICTPARKP
jgi:hypothetical protein